jgi:hypothetical protein
VDFLDNNLLKPYIIKYKDLTGTSKKGYHQGILGLNIITINTGSMRDIGLLNHEMEHCKQYSRIPFISWFYHPLMYLFSDRYRYRSELEAYKKQLDSISRTQTNKEEKAMSFAKSISTNYKLKNVDLQETVKELLL